MRKNLAVFGVAILMFGIPATFYLNAHGYTEEPLGLMLRISARIALLIYLAVFIARPLRQLTANAASKWLLTNRRYLGITFASIMTAHLILLITLNGIKPVIPGIVAFILVYLMLVTSFDKPAAALGPRRWRILHKSGLYFIGAIFSITVVSNVRAAPADSVYLAMAALMLIALGIRIAAWAKRKNQ